MTRGISHTALSLRLSAKYLLIYLHKGNETLTVLSSLGFMTNSCNNCIWSINGQVFSGTMSPLDLLCLQSWTKIVGRIGNYSTDDIPPFTHHQYSKLKSNQTLLIQHWYREWTINDYETILSIFDTLYLSTIVDPPLCLLIQ